MRARLPWHALRCACRRSAGARGWWIVAVLALVACKPGEPERRPEPAPVAADGGSTAAMVEAAATADAARIDQVGAAAAVGVVAPKGDSVAPGIGAAPTGPVVAGGPAPDLAAAPAPAPLGDPSEWTEVVTLDPTIRLDIRYATAANFVGEPLYPCGRCFLRPEVASALARAHKALQARGYGGLLLFDCYRPRPVQQKMWDRVPDADAVAPPWRGSMHNRGVAVDLSLVDADGHELDLGTPYDEFSPRAAHSYAGLPAAILGRRRDLRTALAAEGFAAYNAEWWHFSRDRGRWPLADAEWECP